LVAPATDSEDAENAAMEPPVRRLLLYIYSVIALGLLGGCGGGASPDDQKPVVGVSILPQKWLVEQLAGEEVEVIVLVEPGESPATYQPTDAQITRLMRAPLYVRIGVPFESRGQWLDSLRRTAPGLRIVDQRRNVPLRRIEAHGEHGDEHEHHAQEGAEPSDHGHVYDPHIWLAPPLLRTQAETVAAALSDVLPEQRERIAANRRRLQAALEQADGEIARTLAPCRGEQLFLFHPSWGYFCETYGLEQVPVEIGGKEPTDAELTQLQRQMRQAGVQVIFVQPQISSRAAARLAERVGAEVATLDPLAPDVLANLRQAAQQIAEALCGR
jgi:zinc transport system substrate-binding protein